MPPGSVTRGAETHAIFFWVEFMTTGLFFHTSPPILDFVIRVTGLDMSSCNSKYAGLPALPSLFFH
jgi:hypothetical protein